MASNSGNINSEDNFLFVFDASLVIPFDQLVDEFVKKSSTKKNTQINPNTDTTVKKSISKVDSGSSKPPFNY